MYNGNNDFLKDILLRLKTSRICRGYRFKDNFSDAFGISRSTYSAHESGKKMEKISLVNLKKYAEHLEINLLWLIFGCGEPCGEKDVTNKINSIIKKYEEAGEISPVYPPVIGSDFTASQINIELLKVILLKLLEVTKKEKNIQPDEFVDFLFHLYNQMVTLSCADEEKDKILGICISSYFHDIKSIHDDLDKDQVASL